MPDPLLQINIDPESLKPKLPSRKDLKPYPTTCYLEYKGHKGPVTTISVESTGQWIASGLFLFFLKCFKEMNISEELIRIFVYEGSKDGTVRIWEVETGRCLQTWDLGEPIEQVAWNPLLELPMLAVAV